MDRFSYCLGLHGLRGGRESFNKVTNKLLQDDQGPLLWDFRLHPRTLQYPKAVLFPSPWHYHQPKAHLREGMKSLARPSLSSKEQTQSEKKTEPTWLQKVEPTFFCNVHIFNQHHMCILNISPLLTKVNPASEFVFQSSLQNQPYILSTKSLKRMAGCM